MLRSLYAGVSGLCNSQIRLDVIGNNIANVSTIGYKSSRVTFKDMLSQTMQAATSAQDGRGGVNPIQIGLGVALGSIDTDHTQGSRQTTGKTEDLSIQGNGFFVLRNGDSIVYTRAGAFDKDEDGFLGVPGTGMRVQGWVDGQLQDISLSNSSYAAEPTSTVTFANNLNAYASGDETTFTTTADVYDSLGGLHTVTIQFDRGADPTVNSWNWTLTSPDLYDGAGAVIPQGGVLQFGSDGCLLSQTSNSISFRPQTEQVVDWPDTAFVPDGAGVIADWDIPYTGLDGAAHEINVSFSETVAGSGLYNWTAVVDGGTTVIAQGRYDVGDNTSTGDSIAYAVYSPATALDLTLDFSQVTSSDGENTLAVSNRDGARGGSLKSYSIDFAGNVVGEFTNGMMRTIGQVALAKFSNPAGLQKAGDTTYIESNNSGIALLGRADTVGFGSITPGSLEMSNVNLSQEFTDMIITQRGLQANSRIITTSDEVLQEIVSLKR